ncbi:MAG: hypothetical protein V4550_06625 [Gemmatimonadota bacterium]
MNSLMFVRRTLVPVAVALIAPLAAHAQERQVFVWSGRVDREIRISARGNQLSNSRESNMQTRGRFMESSALPHENGYLRVVTQAGRGYVEVLQQPNSDNDYSAVIRIVDNEGGADNYRLAVYYTPADGRAGRGRGYGRDDRDDRRDGRDDGRTRDRNDRNDSDRGNSGRYGRQTATLHWSGDVDGEAQVIWRANSVSQRTLSGGSVRVQNSSVSGDPAERQYGQLTLNVRQGRGRVDVVQQPSAQNRWTGIIRIVDPQGGYGRYDIDARWQ